ncbi:MAG: hypothetical protein M9958_01870 [Chitinophagales bacterium]|nr:hypothetical protein [Chitinophagales bacterium]
MKKKFKISYWMVALLFFTMVFSISSCKKDKIISGEKVQLKMMTDTLTFDTLFVSLGSTTKYFTVSNPNKEAVEIGKIYLKGDAGKSFRISIDGDTTNMAQNVIIPGKDSIYIFVEVTVDPNADQLPFIITDEVVFETNGSKQNVILQAYGQNAHFYNGESIETQTWTNDLPYVILNSIEVLKGHTLTIQEGVTVYFGGNSAMYVNGTLNINGGVDSVDWVTFRGYRLDKQVTGVAYDQLPGQWTGVFLMRESGVHNINHLKMRGSQFGLNVGNTTLEGLNTVAIENAPTLKISNSEIYNSSSYGLFGFLGKIEATNVLIHDVGKNAFAATLGGIYSLTHCTFYLRSSNYFDHKEPAVYASDYHVYNSQRPALLAQLDLKVTNTIIDGTAEEEIIFDISTNGQMKSRIENSALRTREGLPNDVISLNNLINEKIDLENTAQSNFHLKEGSILIDRGKNMGVLFDIEGKARDEKPDIGAYEF